MILQVVGALHLRDGVIDRNEDLELREQPDLMATRLCFRFAAKGRLAWFSSMSASPVEKKGRKTLSENGDF